jgi:predicted nucleic acid-binding protein
LHSEIVDLEIESNPDRERKRRLQLLIPRRRRFIAYEEPMLTRAIELERRGFTGIDALHLACAERAAADFLLTTDDALLRLAARHKDLIQVRVVNPLAWVQDSE